MDIRDQLRQAVREGQQVRITTMYDPDLDQWHLQAFWPGPDGESFFQGKGFRAPDQEAAEAKVQRQFTRLMGESAGSHYSDQYRTAKAALEKRIAAVLDQLGTSEPNVIVTRRIRINKVRGEPLVGWTKGTTIDGLKRRYDPEYSAYLQAFRQEMGI